MVRCCVNGCKSESRCDKYSFHYFPKDPGRRKGWLDRIRVVNGGAFEPSEHAKICQRHFTEDQYLTLVPEFAKVIGYNHRVVRKLRQDAFPSVFDSADTDKVSRPLESSDSETESPAEIRKKFRREESSIDCETHLVDTPEYVATPLFSTVTTTTSTVHSTTATSTSTCSVTSTRSSLHWFADLTERYSKSDTRSRTFSTQTQTPHNLVPKRSIGCQGHVVKVSDQATQTQTTEQPLVLPACFPSLNDSLHDSELTRNDSRDMEWSLSNDDETLEEEPATPESKEVKFIVYKKNLEDLMSDCQKCGKNCFLEDRIVGTCVHYRISCCGCGHVKEWSSQPYSGCMPVGNLVLSAGIMFSGASALQSLRLLDFAGICAMSLSTYMSVQSAYLTPAVRSVWQQKQVDLMNERKGRPVRLGGDGRCCSPGHTAKFGSYSLMDLETGHVLDIQLVQSNEVANSYAMEKEGLIRALDFLINDNQLQISHLVTDRHSAVKKFMREQHPDIQHWFDVWHVAKGVFKKLVNAGKKKGSEKTKAWAQSVSNHIYWCAATSDGDGELVKQKWLSILNHVVDIHEGHGERFPHCAHDELQEERDWMEKGRKPYADLEKVVKGPLLLKDIQKISPAQQTSSLEAYHKVVCAFAPKSVHYFHAQMEARLFLAGLHFNENCGRLQSNTKDGSPRYRVSFPKGRMGAGVAKEVKTKMTFQYVADLMEEVLFLRESNKSYVKAIRARKLEEPQRPVPIAHSTPRASKADIVKAHTTRFNR